MATTATPEFTIVGAGLAGALLACYLARAGRRVDLWERRPDPRQRDPERGRSINLALSVRGIHALRQIGLADEVLSDAIPMRGRMIHARDGRLSFQPYGKDQSECIHSVSRAGLNRTLIQAAARFPTVRLFFRQRCTGVDLDTTTIELLDEETRERRHEKCEVVVGADGAYSAVRAALQRSERFDYQQEYLGHGYKELTIPPAADGVCRLEKHALHIWPRKSFMMIALPNADGSCTCTLFYPHEGAHSFAALTTDEAVRRFFEEQFPDAVPLMPALVEEFRTNPVGPLLTVRCRPWHRDGRVVLIGDACHAVVPFLGQGMNAAFEDCVVLEECLRDNPDRAAAFRSYEVRRKEHTDALADLAIDNFLEMRDRVTSPLFRLRKRAEIALHWALPRWYRPLYTLVTFTRTPYAEARRRAHWQDRIVGIVAATALLLALFLLCSAAWRS